MQIATMLDTIVVICKRFSLSNGHTLSSSQASSDPSALVESSLKSPPMLLDGGRSKISGGEFISELEAALESPNLDPGEPNACILELKPALLFLCSGLTSSTELKDGDKPSAVAEFGGAGDEAEEPLKSSCLARDAFRKQTVLPISVMVADTWLAGASRGLTGDIPRLVA